MINIISVPKIGVTVSKPSARATVIAFFEQMIQQVPGFCERMYSYMAQEYLPDHPNASLHVLAKRRNQFPKDGYANADKEKPFDTLTVLSNGWFLNINNNPCGFAKQLLARVEEMLNQRGGNIQVYAHLVAAKNGNGIRHYTPEQCALLAGQDDQQEESSEPVVPLEGRDARLLQFWTGLVEYSRTRTDAQGSCSQTPGPRHWHGTPFRQPYGSVGFGYLTGRKEISCHFWLGNNKQKFNELLARKAEIEAITGPLVWDEKPGKKASSIGVDIPHPGDDQQAYKWLIDTAIKFKEAFIK